MSLVAEGVSLLLAPVTNAPDSSGEKIALYGMIGVLGSAFMAALGLALNTYIGRRPVADAAEVERLDFLENWIRLRLGFEPDLLTTGYETLQEMQHARPRPHP